MKSKEGGSKEQCERSGGKEKRTKEGVRGEKEEIKEKWEKKGQK